MGKPRNDDTSLLRFLKKEGPLKTEEKIKKYSVNIAGHATSLSLEPAFWQLLSYIAKEKNLAVRTLVEKIDTKRSTNLSSAIRLYILHYFFQKS